MANAHPNQPDGASARAAWAPVLDALVRGLDTPGLSAHDQNLIHASIDAVVIYIAAWACDATSAEEREREGLEIVAAGLRRGIDWMPENSLSSKAFRPLLRDVQYRLVADLRAKLAAARGDGEKAASSSLNERRRHERIWKTVPRERREHLVLDAVASGASTLREISEHVDAAVCAEFDVEVDRSRRRNYLVYHSDARSVVMRMLAEGKLERTEKWRGNSRRVRYHVVLDGPIAELDRLYRESDAA